MAIAEKKKNINRTNFFVLMFLFLFVYLVTVSYSHALDNKTVTAVLQYHLDLSSPPDIVSAISLADQETTSGKHFLKGTKFLGMINKTDEGLVILFDSVQSGTGVTEMINGKSILGVNEVDNASGVSAKLGQTLQAQTKSNVLGAIFTNPKTTTRPIGSVLPRGTELIIELN